MTKSTNSEPKSSKKYTKTRGEHYKDIVIAILVTSIVAFVGGALYAGSVNSRVEAAKTNQPAPAKK